MLNKSGKFAFCCLLLAFIFGANFVIKITDAYKDCPKTDFTVVDKEKIDNHFNDYSEYSLLLKNNKSGKIQKKEVNEDIYYNKNVGDNYKMKVLSQSTKNHCDIHLILMCIFLLTTPCCAFIND